MLVLTTDLIQMSGENLKLELRKILEVSCLNIPHSHPPPPKFVCTCCYTNTQVQDLRKKVTKVTTFHRT